MSIVLTNKNFTVFVSGGTMSSRPPVTPSSPTLTFSNVTSSSIQINLAGQAVTGTSISSYILERSLFTNSNFTQVYNNSLNSYTDSGLTSNTRYYYKGKIRQNNLVESSFSSVVSTTTQVGVTAGDITYDQLLWNYDFSNPLSYPGNGTIVYSYPIPSPNAPTVVLNSITTNSMVVNVIGVPTVGTITNYTVERSVGNQTSWNQIYSASSSSFVNSGLTTSTVYYYRARFTQSDGQTTSNGSVSSATTLSLTGDTFNPPWPRLGGWPIGNPHNYDAESNRAFWSNRSLVVFTHWDGWESGRTMNMRDIIANMKSRQDPSVGGLEVYAYVVNEALESETRFLITYSPGSPQFQNNETVYVGSSLGSASFTALVDLVGYDDSQGSNAVWVNGMSGSTTNGQILRGATSGATATINQFVDGSQYESWKKVNDSNWWVYRSGSSGVKARSFFDTKQWMPNNSSYCPQVNGEIWTEWHAEYVHNFLFNGRNQPGKPFNTPNPNWAGLFWDNVFYVPLAHGNNPTVDWDRDGTDDSDTDPDVIDAQTLGFKKGWDRYKQLRPNGKVIGNIGWFESDFRIIGSYNQGVTRLTSFDYSRIPNYYQQVEGGIWEYCFDDYGLRAGDGIDPEGSYNKGWIGSSDPTFNGFESRANGLRFLAGAIKSDRLICGDATLSPSPSTSNDYQRLRYGLGTVSILSNFWYYGHPNSYNGNLHPDYDEFTKGGISYGWMGYPDNSNSYGSSQINPYQNGVYRRDFTNAVVLVNPPGNGVRTVTLPFNVRRIQGRSGKSDLSVNNGEIITAGTGITLQDRDGLFLLKI